MSIEDIDQFVRKLVQEDDSLSNANCCRDSVLKIKSAIIKEFPSAITNFLVFPEARQGNGVHYSLLVSKNDKQTLVNTVAAPGFPEYIGNPDQAFPIFSIMRITSKVI